MQHLILFLIILSSMTACADSQPDPAVDSRPNIVYVLADDLGYGELGSYGQQLIETPHLNQLAASGMRFTQHYSGAPVCAPARAVLLMGMHSGHAHVRGNDENASRGEVWNYQAMFDNPSLEGQRPIPDSLFTLAEMLKTAGYATALVGKWGLGAPGSEGTPNRQGFDYFYGYNCQRQAHNLYPTHLWENDVRVMLNNKLMAPHLKREPAAGQSDSAFFQQFIQPDYAPTLLQKAALKFMRSEREAPFFLYYASPLPHLPLQAPQGWIDHYHKKLGAETAYRGKGYFPAQYPRATYAAMISYLDEQIGELVAALKQSGDYDNTLFIFTSDNGPTYTGGADTEFFHSARPFRTAYGYGKGFVYEGGIRVPMLAAWPGRIAAGSTSDHISAFQDVFPTLAEVAGEGIPIGLDGISFLPALKGEQQTTHPYLYWEFPGYGGQQAVRLGKWKGIRKNMHDGNLTIELYDLENDPGEEHDLATEQPEVVAEIAGAMEAEHTTSPFERFRFAVLGE